MARRHDAHLIGLFVAPFGWEGRAASIPTGKRFAQYLWQLDKGNGKHTDFRIHYDTTTSQIDGAVFIALIINGECMLGIICIFTILISPIFGQFAKKVDARLIVFLKVIELGFISGWGAWNLRRT